SGGGFHLNAGLVLLIGKPTRTNQRQSRQACGEFERECSPPWKKLCDKILDVGGALLFLQRQGVSQGAPFTTVQALNAVELQLLLASCVGRAAGVGVLAGKNFVDHAR